MPRIDHQSIDDYIAAQPAAARSVLKRVRATIRKALPGATEGISYQIPIYKLNGAMVMYFAGFQHHYSIYPATARVVGALGREAATALHSKATLRFPLDEPVPTGLITRVAKLRAAEVEELMLAKAAKKKTKTAKKKTKPTPRRKPAKRQAKK